ncbi:hypothetical protein CABS02_15056 [Colletotrichum abscissum]|uniref:Uncharacterized protein n=1 Tax=Colletotrichum abscissum TaxID=1671311 RepID=A0A9P9WZZ3_9PEZI|nr:hypothetical protein CABS02_15056 [Colletotrichum abscissum]
MQQPARVRIRGLRRRVRTHIATLTTTKTPHSPVAFAM